MEILLIWDIDGTLINCRGVGRKAMNAAFEKLYGIPSGFDAVSMAGRLDMGIVGDAMEIHGIIAPDYTDFYRAYGAELQDMMKLHKPYVHDGVLDVLRETSRSGRVMNTVGTGNCEVGARLKLAYTGLSEFIELGEYGNGHLSRSDLIGAVIESAQNRRGVDFDRASIFVIGDTPLDIQAGRENNVMTIALQTGGYSYEELMAFGPDYIMGSLSDKEAFYSAIRL